MGYGSCDCHVTKGWGREGGTHLQASSSAAMQRLNSLSSDFE